MGMFDWVRWLGPLPKMQNKSRLRIALEQGEFQTKSVKLWESDKWSARAIEEGCVTITVDKNGRMLDPDGNHLLWFGVMQFYGGGVGFKWVEFTSRFQDGKMVSVTKDTQ